MPVNATQQNQINDAKRIVDFYCYWLWNYMTADKDKCFDPRLLFDDLGRELDNACKSCRNNHENEDIRIFLGRCFACDTFFMKKKNENNKKIFKTSIQLLCGDEYIDCALEKGKLLKNTSSQILLGVYSSSIKEFGALLLSQMPSFYPELPVNDIIENPLSQTTFENYELYVGLYIKNITNTAIRPNTNSARAFGLWLWDNVTHTKKYPSVEKAIEYLKSSSEYPGDFLENTGLADTIDEADAMRKYRRYHQRTTECIKHREVLSIR